MTAMQDTSQTTIDISSVIDSLKQEYAAERCVLIKVLLVVVVIIILSTMLMDPALI